MKYEVRRASNGDGGDGVGGGSSAMMRNSGRRVMFLSFGTCSCVCVCTR